MIVVRDLANYILGVGSVSLLMVGMSP